MRLASSTSSAAVSSWCLPISFRKSCSESVVSGAVGVDVSVQVSSADVSAQLDAACLELAAELLDLVLVELVLDCERLQLGFLDRAALLGVLDEDGERMTVEQRVQCNVVQRNPLLKPCLCQAAAVCVLSHEY